jgi:hypothetical protein
VEFFLAVNGGSWALHSLVLQFFQWAGSSMVEQLPLKQRVGGSSPPRLTTSLSKQRIFGVSVVRARMGLPSGLPPATKVASPRKSLVHTPNGISIFSLSYRVLCATK